MARFCLLDSIQPRNRIQFTTSEAYGMENTSIHETSVSTPKAEIAPDHIAPKGYLAFVEAREFAASLGLKTRKEWRIWVKEGLDGKQTRPANIPAHPDGIYKVRGWQGWKYWLGTSDASVISSPEDLN